MHEQGQGGPGDEPPRRDASRQNAVYRRMVAICDEVADAALAGADPATLTSVFAGCVRSRVVLLDPEFAVRAESAGEQVPAAERWDVESAGVATLLRTLRTARRPLRVPAVPGSAFRHGCVLAPITVGEATLGYLLVEDGADADDADLLIVTYAATLFALPLAHERTSTELGARYQRAALDALVSGHFLDARDAERKAASVGLAEGEEYRIGVLRARGATLDPARAEALAARLSAGCAGVIATVRGPEVVLLAVEQEQGRTGREVAAVLAGSRDAGCGCGLSEPTRRPELAPRMLRQAEQTIDLGNRLGRDGDVLAHDELGIYRLLLRIGELPQLWQFAYDVLGPVIEHDRRQRAELVDTLAVYLAQHGSLKQAARVLRVHPNTVAYRTQRIERMTGLRLADPDDRLLAHVAVKIVESWREDDAAGGP